MSASESYPDRLLSLAEEFVDNCRAGMQPDLEAYVRQMPEYANEIRDLFPAMRLCENIANDESAGGRSHGLGATTEPSLKAGQQLGDYQVIREVGRGGMGIVYEARQQSLQRRVALKVLSRHLVNSQLSWQRFELEAQTAARLHHTNIVPVYSVGQHEDIQFFSMQFIEGIGLDQLLNEMRQRSGNSSAKGQEVGSEETLTRSIAHALDSQLADSAFLEDRGSSPDQPKSAHDKPSAPQASTNGPLQTVHATDSPGELITQSVFSDSSGSGSGRGGSRFHRRVYWKNVARLGAQAAGALQYAHDQGILHRDVKPSNFLLDASLNIWLTDFGLAKIQQESDLTRTGDILGTIRYMPPEAFRGQTDCRSDVYSLGLTLFELLSGQPAYQQTDRNQLIEQIINGAPTPIRTYVPAMPSDLETIVHKAIDREPAGRYQSAKALEADLQRYLRGVPIQARRATSLEQVWRWAKRKPLVAALLATLAFSLAAGFVLVSWKWRESEWHRKSAEGANTELKTANQQVLDANENLFRAKDVSDRNLYFSDIANVFQLYHLNQPDQARTKLAQARLNPHAGIKPAWEWRYLDALLNSEIHALQVGIPGAPWVRRIEYSDEGKYLAIGNQVPPFVGVRPNTRAGIKIFDAQTGRLCWDLAGGSFSVYDIAFSHDSRKVACSHFEQVSRFEVRPCGFRVWELAGDTTELAHDIDFDDPIHRLLFTGDDRRLIGHNQSEIFFWNLEDARLESTINPGFVLEAISLTDEANLIQLRGRDGNSSITVSLDLESGNEIDRVVRPQAGTPVVNGKWVVQKVGRSEIHLQDSETGELVNIFRGHRGDITAFAISANGQLMASGGTDNTVRIWDLQSGKQLRNYRGHADRISSLQFSPDGNHLASGDWAAQVRVWDVGRSPGHFDFGGHGAFITYERELTNNETEILLAKVAADKKSTVLQRYSLDRGELLQQFTIPDSLSEKPFPPHKILDFTNRGRWLIATMRSDPAKVAIIDTGSGEPLATLQGHLASVDRVQGSRQAATIITTSATYDGGAHPVPGEVLVWDAQTWQPRLRIVGDDFRVRNMAVDSNGNRLLMACRGPSQIAGVDDSLSPSKARRYEMWDLEQRTRVWTAARPPNATLQHSVFVDFNQAGNLAAVYDWANRKFTVFEASSGDVVSTFAGEDYFFGMTFSHDDERLIASTRADTTVFDIDSGYRVLTLPGIPKLYDPIFLPHPLFDLAGQRLFAIQHNGHVRVWDARRSNLGADPDQDHRSTSSVKTDN